MKYALQFVHIKMLKKVGNNPISMSFLYKKRKEKHK